MKIAIPVIDKELQRNRIAGGLNVIGYVCIFDTVSGEGRWMKTLDLAPNMGELLPALESENISTIISRQVQPMALKVLVNKGFSVYKSVGDLLDENILLMIKNELVTFDMEAAMANAAVCGGACGVCTTVCETPDPESGI
jgi:predicted Fe-Mo cluster-binding NifX family protein